VGDCKNTGQVTIDELILMVNIALDEAPVSECPAGDPNHDGKITIDEIIIAENNALNGCMLQTSFSAFDGVTPLNDTTSICPVAWSPAPHRDFVRIPEAGFVAAGVSSERRLPERSEGQRRSDNLQIGNRRHGGRRPPRQST
jgi:hypothetical protein